MAVGAICSLAQLSCFGVCTQRFSSFPGAPVNRSQWRGRMKTRKHPKGSYVLLLMFYKESCGCQMNLGPTPAVAAFFSGNPEQERKVLANISFVHFGNCFWFCIKGRRQKNQTKVGELQNTTLKFHLCHKKTPTLFSFLGFHCWLLKILQAHHFKMGLDILDYCYIAVFFPDCLFYLVPNGFDLFVIVTVTPKKKNI